MSLVIGFVLLVCVGILHNAALALIARATPKGLRPGRVPPSFVFAGLALIHLVEIAIYALAYMLLEHWLWPDSFSGNHQGRWSDWLYYSGINFTTLGYTGIDVTGPMRMVSMMQSLGGFMVLTWSATYLYTVCEGYWSE